MTSKLFMIWSHSVALATLLQGIYSLVTLRFQSHFCPDFNMATAIILPLPTMDQVITMHYLYSLYQVCVLSTIISVL